MTIIVRAELRVLPGRREQFLDVAQALAAAAAGEPGTLRYGWYDGADPDEFVVIEEYADPAAGLEHNRHCAPLLQRIPEVAEMAAIHIHGEPSRDLEEWAAERPFVHVHRPLSPAPPAP